MSSQVTAALQMSTELAWGEVWLREELPSATQVGLGKMWSLEEDGKPISRRNGMEEEQAKGATVPTMTPRKPKPKLPLPSAGEGAPPEAALLEKIKEL